MVPSRNIPGNVNIDFPLHCITAVGVDWIDEFYIFVRYIHNDRFYIAGVTRKISWVRLSSKHERVTIKPNIQ